MGLYDRDNLPGSQCLIPVPQQIHTTRVAQHGYTPEQITTLDRLAYMGKRGMGALEFRPSRAGNTSSSAPLQMASLVEVARRAVQGTLGDDETSANALNSIISVGTSAGGARAKAVLGWNQATGDLVSGQFDLPDGFEHWLLKFDGMGLDRALGPSQQYGRIEYAYSEMAGAAGVVMSPCWLLQENGRAHFMTKRFDRVGNQKVHVQSLCAMRHMDYNARQTHAYESLFLTAAELKLGDEAMTQLFRRMAPGDDSPGLGDRLHFFWRTHEHSTRSTTPPVLPERRRSGQQGLHREPPRQARGRHRQVFRCSA